MEVRRASLTGKAMDVPASKEKGGRMDPIGGSAKSNGLIVSSKSLATGGKLANLGTLSGGRGDALASRGSLPADGLLGSKGGMIIKGPLPYNGDLASNGGSYVGMGGGVGVVGTGGTGSQGFVELSRRRLANDPAMMRELKRYQELMLKTLLPKISSSEGEQHHAPPWQHYTQDTADSLPTQRGQPDGMDDPDKTPSEHLPRPEPTDAIAGTTQQHLTPLRRTASYTTKSACSHESQGSKTMPAGPASAGTRLPHAVYNPMDTSPRPSHRRRSNDETSPRSNAHRSHDEGPHRRRSQGDETGEEEEDVDPTSVTGANPGELDLLTLTALYLESRHRVLGQEWHHRPDAPANTRTNTQVVGAGLGGTGIARPRRLSPLSPSDSPPKDDKDRASRIFSAVMPTPAGLHLSVNYTHNLGLEESIYLAERARALRPRLRRLNSLDDLLPSSSPSASSASYLQKATSAPDLSSSGHGKKGNLEMVLSRVSSQDSLSPPLVTPARANTPTEPRHSAALVRPQMVGGSLVTNSTVDTARSINTYGQGQDVLSTHLTKRRHLSDLPDSSRTALLPPPRLSLRGSRIPQDSMVRELPRTPPPTASNEGMRKMGRVHLEPLSVRKSSN